MTWSPALKSPLMTIFSASVIFTVNTTLEGLSKLKSLHKCSLVSYTPSADEKASIYAPRPIFIPLNFI